MLYVDERWLPERLTGAAVRTPSLADPALVRGGLRAAPAASGEPLEAESRLALVAERIALHLDRAGPPAPGRDPGLARLVRDRLRRRTSRRWRRWPASWARTRRTWCGCSAASTACRRTATSSAAALDRARRLLLDGMPIAEVAAATGFHDQSHLTRHFRALLGHHAGRVPQCRRDVVGMTSPLISASELRDRLARA